MRALTIASLTVGLIVSIACIAPPPAIAAAAEKSEFIKKPKVMGSKVSTVTGFRAKKGDGSGFFMNCSGRCGNGATLRWRCEIAPDIIQMHCGLHCSPPPAHGLCLPE
jgi:hypothetical protein